MSQKIKENAPEFATHYAIIKGVITYFYQDGNNMFFMSGKPYLHVSITRFYRL